jgi:hypothetical protein
LILIDCSSLVLEVICFVRFDEAVHFLVLLNTFGNWEFQKVMVFRSAATLGRKGS